MSDDPLVWARRCLALPVGEIWECGVYKGGTALILAAIMSGHHRHRVLRLFDTFTGRPEKGPFDTGRSDSDFADTSLEAVRAAVGPHGFVQYHAGRIPQTFDGLEESRIAFAYVDMDLYQSTYDALRFIMPRLVSGGVILVDDYLEPETWPGVRIAVDELAPHAQAVGRAAVIRAA